MNVSEIKPCEIRENDTVKILAKEDDIEEEMFARVAMNTGNVLGVHYLYPTTKLYKSATCYRLEDEMQPVSFESLTLHYPGGTFEDASFRRVNSTPELWAPLDEINEDEESEIWSEEEDSDSEDSLDGFIVRDEDVPESERAARPSDARDIDRAWNDWEPMSPGAKRYKEVVNSIEERIKHSNDAFY